MEPFNMRLILISIVFLVGCGPFNFEVSMALTSGENQTLHRKTESKVSQNGKEGAQLVEEPLGDQPPSVQPVL